MKSLTCIIFCFCFCQINAQESIDGSFEFQTDPAKKYSIYVPSGYDLNTSHELLLAFHPLNVNRWNSTSWRDTLIDFAEHNNLLMVAPDGGIDGKVDDAIDTAFTTVLLDSMMHWYNVQPEKIYAIGFSWGGRTTYTYGLNNPGKFAGFIPIGAAINGLTEVDDIIEMAEDKAFYVVHGGNDVPNTRFTPIVNALDNSGACVETNLMNGVGHTIDFPNRNQILTNALDWIKSINCGISSINAQIKKDVLIYPNPLKYGEKLRFQLDGEISDLMIYNINGQLAYKANGLNAIDKLELNRGLYIIKGATSEGEVFMSKLLVH